MRVRNERAHIIMNLKKQLFQFLATDPIQGQSVDSWNMQMISQLKLNSEVTSDSAPVEDNGELVMNS
jgi:hypothetical protein